jgi:hypothetical protein
MVKAKLAAVLLLISGSAIAAEVPQSATPLWATAPNSATVRTIDMTVVLHSPTGEPLKDAGQITPEDPRCDKCRPLTLGIAAANALFSGSASERNLAGDQKFARYLLAERIKNAKEATLTAEEITAIKRLVGEIYSPVVVGQAYPLLDPNATAPKVQ